MRREIEVRLSRPGHRSTDTLAVHGGQPVRDVVLRPWTGYPFDREDEWESFAPVLERFHASDAAGRLQQFACEVQHEWAAYCGTRRALLLPQGSDALQLALAAALDRDGLEHGAEVIVPNLSGIASCNAARAGRFGIALVDVDPRTLLIDPSRVEDAIIPGRTRAILVVHLAGQPADMAAVRDIAKRHSLVLIEDAAHAHGAVHDLGRAGTLGHAAAFSFQGYQHLPSDEGSVLTTDNDALFERASRLLDVGDARRGGTRQGHAPLGSHARLTGFFAAVLLHRLKRFEREQDQRERCARVLHDRLSDVTCLEPSAMGAGVRRHARHLFLMRYRSDLCHGVGIDDFVTAVNGEGVPLIRLFDGRTIAQQPACQALREMCPDHVRVLPTPVSDRAVEDVVFLPSHRLLGTEADLTEIIAAFRKVQAHYDLVGTCHASPRQRMGAWPWPSRIRPISPVPYGPGVGPRWPHRVSVVSPGSYRRPPEGGTGQEP